MEYGWGKQKIKEDEKQCRRNMSEKDKQREKNTLNNTGKNTGKISPTIC